MSGQGLQEGGDSNNGPHFGPQRLFESDSPGHSNLVSDGVQVSYLWFPGGCHIWSRAADLTSTMA